MSMKKVVYRDDYREHPFTITSVKLDFTFDFNIACVVAELQVNKRRRFPEHIDFILDGVELDLKHVFLKHSRDKDFKELLTGDFHVDEHHLTIKSSVLPGGTEPFALQTVVRIYPSKNTQLTGLYKSQDVLCTQCEAEGFRRISYFIDRPDNKAIFFTTLRADKNSFPVLLSNGNLCSSTSVNRQYQIYIPELYKSDLHEVTYFDPWPKPSYLFAIVAGKLSNLTDTFKKQSGEIVELKLWCEKEHTANLQWSLRSLKKAMKWDEITFGREFDLSTYHLVAVPHFNMGAMENKGLNIFNASCLLVSKDTGTDRDFETCMVCVAHEYFHNWTGNRVTCRDWFQLVVKEGLTVFREQLFTEDETSRASSRIASVNVIKSAQFLEDSSPLAHAIVPESYQKIDNMYTLTVYRKGPEVIRMYSVILGQEGFRKGMHLYFERHDGKAVTYQDLHKAMEDANQIKLSQFTEWFTQVGTPTVTLESQVFDFDACQIILKLRQSRPDQSDAPLLIPVLIGLIGKTSKKNLLKDNYLLQLNQHVQTFVFHDIHEDAYVSLFRGFSAPVKLEYSKNVVVNDSFMVQYDDDPLNKWEAAQKLYTSVIVQIANRVLNCLISDILGCKATDKNQDKSFLAQLLAFPNKESLMQSMVPCDPVMLSKAIEFLRTYIARKHRQAMIDVYITLFNELQQKPYEVSPTDVGCRQLLNTLLSYIVACSGLDMALNQYKRADNLTLKYHADHPEEAVVQRCLNDFLDDYHKQDDLGLLQKWFAAQAGARHSRVIASVKELTSNPLFDLANPNIVRHLCYVFSKNIEYFHAKDGKGYEYMKEMILKIDPINAQTASTLAGTFMTFNTSASKKKCKVENIV